MLTPGVFEEFARVLLLALMASGLAYCIASRAIAWKVHLRPEFTEKLGRVSMLRPHISNCIFATLFAMYVLVFSWLSVAKQQTFHTTGDVAIFDQVVWNSLRGRLFENSVQLGSPSHLGVHFSPILLALVPLYAVRNDPSSLLVFQTFALALAAFPLYWLSREWLGGGLAIVVAGAYFLSPALQNVNLGEFHEVSFATLLLSFAIYFLIKKRPVPFLICLCLSLLVKEELAFITAAFGVCIFFQGKPRFGIGLAVIAILWAGVVLGSVIPHFANSENYYAASSLYPAFGKTPAEILNSFVSRPDLLVSAVSVPYKAEFVGYLLVPLALLPLVGAEVSALALPTLGYLLLSDKNLYLLWRFHYTALLLPFLFFGTVVGLRRLLELAPRISGWRSENGNLEDCIVSTKVALAALLIAGSTLSYYLYSQGPLARSFNPAAYWTDAGKSALGNALMRMIPADSSVLTQEEFVPHLSQRRQVYEVPSIPDIRLVDYIFADRNLFSYNYYGLAWDDVFESGYFEVFFEQEGYFLAKRRVPEQALPIQFGDRLSLIGSSLSTDALRGGQALRAILEWRVNQPMPTPYVVELHLADKQGHLWSEDDRTLLEGVSIDEINLWRLGKSVSDQYALLLPSTMPPGEYQLSVSAHESESENNLPVIYPGREAREEAIIASVHVEKDKSSITASQLQEQCQLDEPYYVDMGEMRLIGFKSLPRTVGVGNVLPVGLFWRARSKPRGDYAVSLQLRDAEGRLVFEEKNRPAAEAYATTLWDEGEVLLDWHDLVVPSSVPTGEYALHVVLSDLASGIQLGETDLALVSVVEN